MTTNLETHVMIDIETLGLKPGCTILSLAAVPFNTYRHTVFYETYSRAVSKVLGFVEDADTLAWWENQPAAAKTEAFEGTKNIKESLHRFSQYLDMQEGTPILWANSPSFDLAILAEAYKICGIPQPWTYKQERDYRTLKAVFPQVRENLFGGVQHTASSDALHQARHTEQIYEYIYKRYPDDLKT